MTELQRFVNSDSGHYEVGIDEAGRGPLFGRVYSAAVVIPADSESFPYGLIKDSKRFTSASKLSAIAEKIRQHSVAHAIAWEDEAEIDRTNIRKATHKSMHRAARLVIQQMIKNGATEQPHLLVDGTDFSPLAVYDPVAGFKGVLHTCIKKGDDKLMAIAAASILAKDERDRYIAKLCEEHPGLNERYSLSTNKGYGTQAHLAGLKRFGPSRFHRISFGPCEKLNAAERMDKDPHGITDRSHGGLDKRT